jgi:sugar phosphate isomerase/epimerase
MTERLASPAGNAAASPPRPFRLGTTSYIVPDAILPNVEFLAGRVDDIELVLFESGETSNLPGPAEIAELIRWRDRAGLSYTVHLPLDAQLGAADERLRQSAVAQCLRVIELTRPLDPFAWVLHLDGRRRGDSPADDVADWLAALSGSVRTLLAAGVPPQSLCAETLDYPFELVAPLISELGLAVCLDIGHLVMRGRDVGAHLDRWLGGCRVLHLHGIRDGRDHRDIAALGEPLLRRLLERLASPGAAERVLTVEVFGREDFEASMACLKALMGPENERLGSQESMTCQP